MTVASDEEDQGGAGGDRGATQVLVLGVVAWAAMGLATSGDQRVLALTALLTAGVGLLAWRRCDWFLAAVVGLAAVCVVTGGARAAAQAADPLTGLVADGASAVVDVRVAGNGRLWAPSGTRPGLWRGSAQLVHVEARDGVWRSGASVQVRATGDLAAAWAGVPMGTTVRAAVRLGPAEPGSGLAAELRATDRPEEVAPPDPVAAAVGALRRGLVVACAGLWPEPRALVPALVVGDVTGMTTEMRDRFVVTGLTHLTAVSGANLTLLLGFLRALAVGCGLRGRWLNGVLVAGVAGFVVLCLGEPSVLRAAAMGLVGLAALGRAGRGRQGLRFLGVAMVAVVLAEPAMARSLGFALSVLATFGLLRWAGAWTALLARWMPRWCAEALAVPLAAQVATEPVVVYLSGQVSVVSVLANLVAGPMVGPATVLGLAATLLGPLPLPLALAPAWGAGWFAQGIAWTARLGEALPGAAVPWPVTPASLAVVVLGCVVLVLLAPRVLVRPWLALGIAALVVVALARTPTPPGWPPRAWAVASCDVGQGDATLVAVAPGQAVLVDTGPDPGLLRRCLDQLGITHVPLLLLTHLHADHVGGIPALADRGVAVVATSPGAAPAAQAGLAVALPGARLEPAAAGSAWAIGAARVEVLAAPGLARDLVAGEGESSAENDASLLLRADVGGVSILLAGDAEEGAQGRHVALGDVLDVDVLLVPHHGSGRHAPGFIAAARPEVALVSVGEGNDYGHPAARTLRSVEVTGAAVFRTDQRGAVAVARSPDGGLVVTTQR